MTNAIADIDNKVKRVISNIRNLPTPPIVFHQIQKVINDPNSSAGQVAAVLAEDPAMSVKVLKLTNSAFYGLAREITSVKQAVMVVGMEAIKNLVLSASVLDMFKGEKIDQEFQEEFWHHSLATALCCRLLARNVKVRGMVDPDSVFSGGLLHDIGKIVISCFLTDEYEQFRARREVDETSQDIDIEQEVLGFDHAQIGAYLALQWKLPLSLVDAIGNHHQPEQSEGELSIAHLVNMGSYLARMTFASASQYQQKGKLAKDVLEHLQIPADDLESYSASLREEYVKAETFMQMTGLKA